MHLKERLSSKTILVVGDIILDHYIYGKVNRVSPEAPVPVVLRDKSTYCLGGSANVAQNVTSFGSKCYLLGVVGEDTTAVEIENLLSQKDVIPLLVKDPSRPSTEKTRIVGNGHQLRGCQERHHSQEAGFERQATSGTRPEAGIAVAV